MQDCLSVAIRQMLVKAKEDEAREQEYADAMERIGCHE